MFQIDDITKLKTTCQNIDKLLDEHENGSFMFSQLEFLGALITEFTTNPIVASSGIIPKK